MTVLEQQLLQNEGARREMQTATRGEQKDRKAKVCDAGSADSTGLCPTNKTLGREEEELEPPKLVASMCGLWVASLDVKIIC